MEADTNETPTTMKMADFSHMKNVPRHADHFG